MVMAPSRFWPRHCGKSAAAQDKAMVASAAANLSRCIRFRSGRSQLRHMKPFPASLRTPEIVHKLLVEPAFSTGVEGNRETHGHLRADTGSSIQNGRQRLAANP